MTSEPRILIVDDDAMVASSVVDLLIAAGYRAESTDTAERALEIIDDGHNLSMDLGGPDPISVVITDVVLPGMDGLELVRVIRQRSLGAAPIVITGFGTIESAVKAIRAGAVEYLTKPIVDAELQVAIEKAIREHTLVSENRRLRDHLDQRFGLANIVGSDTRMRRMYDVIEAVAPNRTTVLMSGESGTGKSLIARAIHQLSPRADRPFVEISCGSIPETLLESELFGHVKGAFTGAHTDKPGRFLAADGGTLFLDEINSASPGMQLKLLRVIQERVFEPVGSNEPMEVDVRVVLASNQPLEDLVAAGEFRQDLYYRINVVMIKLPPLRDRVGDIPILAGHFLEVKSEELSKQITGFSEDALGMLRAYGYPGNVRELENIVERAVVLTKSTRIMPEDLPPHVIDGSNAVLAPTHRDGTGRVWTPGEYAPMPLRKALEEPEKQIILAALEANEWNRQQTADVLEINRTTLYKKIKQYGLEEYGRTG